MSVNAKLPVLCLSTLLIAFILFSAVKEPSCQDLVSQARDQYYSGQYEYVPGTLTVCLNDFNNYRTDYVQEGNRDWVFLVYKLIIQSYYQLDDDYSANAKEDELVYYFDGLMHPDDVMRKLDYTEI